MTRVQLLVAEDALRLTLEVLLEARGIETVDTGPDVILTDNCRTAVANAAACPTLVLSGMGGLAEAISAMQQGVSGYILLPLQPGETELMIQRATNQNTPEPAFDPVPLEKIERAHILATVRHCNGNRTKAARLLGIGRNTLWRKLSAIERD